MSCLRPLLAVDKGFDKSTGKHDIRILPRRPDHTITYLQNKYGKSLIFLPCGCCYNCRVDHARSWSHRVLLEASLYNFNWFVTLTYDEEHIGDNKLDYSDIQQFFKNLRYYIPGFRYFGCGEYGQHNSKRRHWHIILFNCNIPDLQYFSSRDGNDYYISPLLSKVWSKGQILISDVTEASACYTARYTLKKQFGDELIFMSNKPGIGADFYHRNKDNIYDTDGIYIHGKKYRVPRYFDKLLEVEDPDRFISIKEARQSIDFMTASLLSSTGSQSLDEHYVVSAHNVLHKQETKLRRSIL